MVLCEKRRFHVLLECASELSLSLSRSCPQIGYYAGNVFVDITSLWRNVAPVARARTGIVCPKRFSSRWRVRSSRRRGAGAPCSRPRTDRVARSRQRPTVDPSFEHRVGIHTRVSRGSRAFADRSRERDALAVSRALPRRWWCPKYYLGETTRGNSNSRYYTMRRPLGAALAAGQRETCVEPKVPLRIPLVFENG